MIASYVPDQSISATWANALAWVALSAVVVLGGEALQRRVLRRRRDWYVQLEDMDQDATWIVGPLSQRDAERTEAHLKALLEAADDGRWGHELLDVRAYRFDPLPHAVEHLTATVAADPLRFGSIDLTTNPRKDHHHE